MSEWENSCGGNGTLLFLYCTSVVGATRTPVLATTASFLLTLNNEAMLVNAGCRPKELPAIGSNAPCGSASPLVSAGPPRAAE